MRRLPLLLGLAALLVGCSSQGRPADTSAPITGPSVISPATTIDASTSDTTERDALVFPPLTGRVPSGQLLLHFHGGFTTDQQAFITDTLMPYLDQVFGAPWQTMDIDVYGGASVPDPSSSFAQFDNSLCSLTGVARGRIQIKDPTDLGALANELTHAHHGCFTVDESRFEEGIGYADNILATYHLGLKSNPCTPYICNGVLYTPNNRPGMGGGSTFDHQTFSYLSSFREVMGGMAWSQYENDHPGFFKALNAQLFSQLLAQQDQQGGQIHGNTLQLNPIATARQLSPDFGPWFDAQHIFDNRPTGPNLLLIATTSQVVVVGSQIDRTGLETALVVAVDLSVRVDVGNPQHASITTDDGVGYVNFPSGSQQIAAEGTSGQLADSLNYVPLFPNSPYLGDVPLKP